MDINEILNFVLLGNTYEDLIKWKDVIKNEARKNKNFINVEDDFNQTSIYIRRALRHEAVHVAQGCNDGKALNISKEKKMKLVSPLLGVEIFQVNIRSYFTVTMSL